MVPRVRVTITRVRAKGEPRQTKVDVSTVDYLQTHGVGTPMRVRIMSIIEFKMPVRYPPRATRRYAVWVGAQQCKARQVFQRFRREKSRG